MTRNQTTMQRGFTFVELLMVITIIAVLAGVIITVFNPIGQMQKAQDVRRKSDLEAIQKSLELYYQDTGRYPPSTLDFKISMNGTPVSWGGTWAPYLARVPADPAATKRYVYFTPASGNGQTYFLYASLDRGAQDQQACNSGNACVKAVSGPGASACGGTCNFGLSSPNDTP